MLSILFWLCMAGITFLLGVLTGMKICRMIFEEN